MYEGRRSNEEKSDESETSEDGNYDEISLRNNLVCTWDDTEKYSSRDDNET